MRLGSLFDGSGTAPLAASMCGIDPIWASEIEPYPIAVTKARFPQMQHLGSILDIDGSKVVPVDIICGGSPCQDLSVAGKQAGIHNGERSHLFFEMTRIIKEMRGATDGKYPRYIVWENVPGAFSSNQGRDFLAVLQAFAEIANPDVHVPEPERRKDRLAWKYAGEMVGDGWSIAWRTVDAQYWGVPQRRRRIYLVADFGSERAGEILFERAGMSRNTEPRGAAREETAGDAGRGVERSGGVRCLNPWDSQTIRQYDVDGVYPALSANSGGGQRRDGIVYPVIARTLTAEYDASPCIDRGQNITVYEPRSMLAENWSECSVKNALRAGESHSAHVCVERVASFMGGQGIKAGGLGYAEEIAPTLKAAPSGANTVPDVVYALQGNGIDRALTAGCNGCGWREDVMYTLNTIDRPALCYPDTARCLTARHDGSPCADRGPDVICHSAGFNDATGERAQGSMEYCEECSPTLRAGDVKSVVYDARGNGDGSIAPCVTGDHERRVSDYTAVCVGNGQLHNISMAEQMNTLDCMHDQQAVLTSGKLSRKYIVRRLTPLECCRLQGFPDWWEDGVEGSDSARYKMWGNGMALPNMLFVMRRIAERQTAV